MNESNLNIQNNTASEPDVIVKFLIIRFSSIGDIVLTTPVIRCLKQQVEGAQVHFLTKLLYKEMLVANPYIDKLHALNTRFSDIVNELKNEEFDYIIDLHKNIRTYNVKSRLKRFSLTFDKLNIEKWLLVNFKINRLPDIHIVDRYFKPVELFDVKNDNRGLDYFIPADGKVDISELSENFQNGYIAFVIGGKYFTKKLPVEKITNICRRVDYPVVLLGGGEDAPNGEIICKSLGHNVYNACGKFTINQSASVVEQAKAVVTNDTGLMHIASAFKKKIISVWGNTVSEFGMYPYMPHPESEIVQVTGLKCRPCTKLGFKKCPKKHFRCMNDIDTEYVVRILKNKI
ncbi:MAG: glycosyltransferase family 9 protein [Bacteroidia bacterium]|nr:glycosyltransferase family 9 protein [Bacteroidia bacterium]